MTKRTTSVFTKSEDGSAAVEFGLIATPFFALFFGIFDICLSVFANSVLEEGVAAAARLVRTGQVVSQNMTETQFRDLVCNRISAILDCDQKLKIDVRTFHAFKAISVPPAINDDGSLNGNTQFKPGNAGDVVMVRAYYSWQMMTPFANYLSDMSGNYRLLETSAVFRNEPYGSQLN